MSLVRLVRPVNLFVVILTQYLFQYCVIRPLFAALGYQTSLNHWEFALLVLSTVFIAASGYIINDYFDQDIDRLNKPDRLIIGKSVSKDTAWRLFTILNLLGIGLGLFIGWKVGNYQLGIIHLAISGLLWFYASSYKRMFLLGNLVVSVSTAMVVLLVLAYEPKVYKLLPTFNVDARFVAKIILYYAIGYAGFAFLINWIREIAKDIYDIEGDQAFDCRTMPIVAGVGVSRVVMGLLVLLTMGLLGYFQYDQWVLGQTFTFVYVGILLQLPLLVVLIQLLIFGNSSQYKWVSLEMKLIMLAGLLYLIYFRTTIMVAAGG